ncbi:MAG: cation:proton antiporter [Acidobacteria bacterium]|nr:cation:proton antiporter [Acidobacteriota bacterium]
MQELSFLALWLTGGAAEASRLPLALLLVFGTAKLLAELFERLGQPGIVGEILAGVILGPSLLGWIAPNELLKTLADLGVMFLLFRVGLEVKPSELMKLGGTATVVAMAGVMVPFAFGWLILAAWGAPRIEAFFLGAAMVATSIGITAQVLAAKGLLRQRSSQIILAAAVIDDVLGLLVLALVSSMARGSVNLLEIGMTALVAVLFVVFIAKWGTRAVGRVVPRMQASLRVAEGEFSLALILLFALSLAAIWIGIAAIVGAFLAGMALAEGVGQRVRDLSHGATELLVPFFLAGIGLHVDLRAFQTPSIISLAVVVLVAAVVSKFIGCGLAAWPLGRADAIRIGVGMVPRGEVGMVVAQIGLALGVIPQSVYSVVVLMAVATTLIAPPLLKLAYRGIESAEAAEDGLRLG